MAEISLWVVTEGQGWSPAPELFEACLHDRGVRGRCKQRAVEPRILEVILDEMRHGVVDGCVLAGAHKRTAVKFCDEIVADATLTGTVNVVVADGETLRGDNTEALGFELGLSMHRRWPHSGARAVVLGAGPAAVAASIALGRVPAVDIAVASRNETATMHLVERFPKRGAVRAIGWNATILREAVAEATVLVNTTPLSLSEIPLGGMPIPFRCSVIDLHNGPRPAPPPHPVPRIIDGFEPYLFAQLQAFERCAGVQADPGHARAKLRELFTAHPTDEVIV